MTVIVREPFSVPPKAQATETAERTDGWLATSDGVRIESGKEWTDDS